MLPGCEDFEVGKVVVVSVLVLVVKMDVFWTRPVDAFPDSDVQQFAIPIAPIPVFSVLVPASSTPFDWAPRTMSVRSGLRSERSVHPVSSVKTR